MLPSNGHHVISMGIQHSSFLNIITYTPLPYKHESGAAPRTLPALYQTHTEQHTLGLSCSLDSGNLPENGEG